MQTEPTLNLANRSSTTECHADNRHLGREDSTTSGTDQSSLRGSSAIEVSDVFHRHPECQQTPAESTIDDQAERTKTLLFFLMKPIVEDLRDVIQLSWKVHNMQLQQTEIWDQINNNEKECVSSVYEAYQNLYAHEHAALEDSISKAGAGSDVSLRALRRIYTDLTHRQILFKGVPGLEFVLERTVQQPHPQTDLSTEVRLEAAAPRKVSRPIHGKNLQLDDFLKDTSKSFPHHQWCFE